MTTAGTGGAITTAGGATAPTTTAGGGAATTTAGGGAAMITGRGSAATITGRAYVTPCTTTCGTPITRLGLGGATAMWPTNRSPSTRTGTVSKRVPAVTVTLGTVTCAGGIGTPFRSIQNIATSPLRATTVSTAWL